MFKHIKRLTNCKKVRELKNSYLYITSSKICIDEIVNYLNLIITILLKRILKWNSNINYSKSIIEYFYKKHGMKAFFIPINNIYW